MKQEAIRKLRHRILAGLLCFSIVFAGQPNGLKASGLLDAENSLDVENTEAEPTEEDTLNVWSLDEGNIDEENVDEPTESDKMETAEEIFLNEDNVPVIAQVEAVTQAVDVHQHSVSTDCSTSAGEQITFQPLPADFGGGVLAEGNYYLSDDVTLNETMRISSGTVKLCLNGHTLQYGGTAINSVIRVNGKLYICDCETVGCITGGTASGIHNPNGSLFLYGGVIKDNTTAASGGGVDSMGTFEMYGGVISGNHASYGGGVDNSHGIFRMYGGTISVNTTGITSGSVCAGGGVYNLDFATFEMYGGVISGNSAMYGGGVYSARSITFKMYGGTISNNTATGTGGGVYNSLSTAFEMNAGTISDNTAIFGGGVVVDGSSFVMNNGSISGNRTTMSGSGVSINEKSTFLMNGGSISKNDAVNTSTAGSVVGGGGVFNQGSFEMNAGEISGNSSVYAGGVYSSGGIFQMRGGSITGNTATQNGGGVWATTVSGGSDTRLSTFVMSGGNIFNNTAQNGGGVAAGGIYEISGGSISNNTATQNGGGIYLVNGETTFKMSGGAISDNTAQNGGGGVFVTNLVGVAEMQFSGKPVINDNKKADNTRNNLQLYSTSHITLVEPLQQGTDVGITYQNGTAVITDAPFAIPAVGQDNLELSNYAQYFTSDVDGYGIFHQDGSTAGRPEGLYLGSGITITYDYEENGGNSVSLASAFMEKNTTLDLSSDAPNAVTAAKEGWEFVGWNTDPDATEGLDTLTVGTTNVTLYAIYKKTITANFYSGNTNQKVTRDITIYNNQTEGTITSPKLADFPGWQAAGWNTDTTGYTGAVPEASDITISEDTDYYGVYQQDVTISYDANGGTTTPASETKKRYANVHNSITYRNPVFILAPAVSRTGYTFDGWHQGSTTGTVKRPGTEVELIGNTTFYADWRLDTDRSYVVEHYWQNVTGVGYTLIDTVPHTGTAGAEVKAEARTYTGFTENTEHPSRKASGIIAEDGSLVLKLYYDRDIYTVSFDLNGAEGTPPEAQTIRYGGTVAPVPAPTWEGYVFTGWYMNDETGSGNRWDFTAAVEENERNQTRIVTHKEIVLYAGWRKESVDTPNEPLQPARPTEPDTGNNNSNNNNTTINNNVTINNSNSGTSPASGKPVPMTGDAAHLELYATAAMIAGLSYLLLEMADEQGMTEEKKRELTARLIRWAKQGGVIRRILAFMAMFLILAYYHAIGKQFSAKSIHVLEK